MEDRDPGGGGPRRVEVPGLSPVRAFFIVGALAALPLVLLATRSAEPATSPEPARSPSYELTDAEAIARFRELHDLFRAASIRRDQSLLKLMLTVDSPLQETAHEQIRQLIADRVVDRSRFIEQDVEVVTNHASRIEIDQIVVIQPRFRTEDAGRRVDAGSSLRQRVRWVLTVDDGVWKVYDSVVLSSKRIR